MRRLFFLAAVLLFILSSLCYSQTNDAAAFTVSLWDYHVYPNVVYHTSNNYQDRLDVYTPPGRGAATPVAIIIHGGGWIAGKKEERVMEVMPYLQMGFAAVNVEYRMADVSPAPAAVVDCRCALHWVVANAKKYNFDVNRIVVTGGSAGGHLALTTGMLTSAAGFDRECWAPDDDVWKKTGGAAEDPHVAAIVNWFGITDVLDEIHGPNIKGYAVVWIGDQPNADEIAKRVSPINMVLKSNPPIITIHGDHDEVVPYSQAVRLKEELDKAGVPNQLYTVAGGGHGGFSPEEMQKIWATIRQFLNQNLKTPAAQ